MYIYALIYCVDDIQHVQSIQLNTDVLTQVLNDILVTILIASHQQHFDCPPDDMFQKDVRQFTYNICLFPGHVGCWNVRQNPCSHCHTSMHLIKPVNHIL